MILRFLRHPRAAEIHDLDAPETTDIHRDIIQEKRFLKDIYTDFYQKFQCLLGDVSNKKVVELGSGPGFIQDIIPEVITSDIQPLSSADMHFSALEMPFSDETVDAFLMLNVFHHIPDAAQFLAEMQRCLKPDGKIIMIEPANTLFSRFIFRHFHHEPFEHDAAWTFPSSGPLSGANGALPWIIFKRDHAEFTEKFPNLSLKKFHMHTPLRYLLSGGVSFRQFVPAVSYPLVKGVEKMLSPLNRLLGMFVTIEIHKNTHA